MREKANLSFLHRSSSNACVDYMENAKKYFLNRDWNNLLHVLMCYINHTTRSSCRRIMFNYVIICLQHHPALKDSGYFKKYIVEHLKLDDTHEKILYDKFL